MFNCHIDYSTREKPWGGFIFASSIGSRDIPGTIGTIEPPWISFHGADNPWNLCGVDVSIFPYFSYPTNLLTMRYHDIPVKWFDIPIDHDTAVAKS
jgi:hypothetical protein